MTSPNPETHGAGVTVSRYPTLCKNAGPYASRPIPTLTERQTINYWRKVVKTPGCWVWTGGTTGHRSHPYGNFRIGSAMYVAHRISWTLAHGPIPSGLVIDHLCLVTLCVNPDHMRLVTQGENVEAGTSARDAGGRFS